ncbi:hypothetical protein [Marinobacterium rhizophilum]|uniref:hypothetical protein n=1 Tax=Marinobacterium rhizophilum TaxID=420402 RepID=UPI00039A8728|nr:hypothetical protein [Marinobacterium rhizophilum]
MDMLNLRSAGMLIALAILQGCVSTGSNQVAESLQFYRGQLSPVGDSWSLQRCYSRQHRVLTDPEGVVRLRYGEQAVLTGLPLYMELKATESGAVRQVLVAGGGSRTCAAELNGVELRAAGADPDWAADLSGNRLEVRDQSRLMRLIFRVEESPVRTGGGREWHGSLKTPAGEQFKVELSLREVGCIDSVGVWYGLKAVMNLNGRSHKGCARYGDLANRSLPGVYRSELVGEAGPLRTIALRVSRDGTAELTENHHDGGGVTVRQGSWRLLPTGKLMLHLLLRDGQAEQQVRLFRRHRDGTLVLEGGEVDYGMAGLRLSPE